MPHLFVFRKDGQKQSLGASSLGGQKLCLIPRNECSFRRIKITGKHKKALLAAQFRVRRESDSDENKFVIIPDKNGSRAGVWGFKTISQHKGRYIPESLALLPMHEGVRLTELINGFEGQVWSDGHLVASRWWGEKPDQKKWTAFLHSVQDEHEIDFQSIPTVLILPYRTDFPAFMMDRDRAADLFSPVKVGGVIALGLTCGFLFISGQYLRSQAAKNDVEKNIEALSSVTAQISSQRRRAISNRREARKYNIAGHSGTFFLGLGDAVSVLDDKGFVIERISLNAGELELRLQSRQEIDVPALVVELEAMPALDGVNIRIAVNEAITMTANLVAPFDYPKNLEGNEGVK